MGKGVLASSLTERLSCHWDPQTMALDGHWAPEPRRGRKGRNYTISAGMPESSGLFQNSYSYLGSRKAT